MITRQKKRKLQKDEEEKDNQKRKRKKTSKCNTSENEILRVESQVEKKKRLESSGVEEEKKEACPKGEMQFTNKLTLRSSNKQTKNKKIKRKQKVLLSEIVKPGSKEMERPKRQEKSGKEEITSIGKNFNEIMNMYGLQNKNRYKDLLEELKTGDDIRIMQGVIDLSTELSMAQENTMNNFSSDQFIPILVDCLKKEAFPDIMIYATMCLTQIMDILPNTCSKIVNNGAVKLLVDKMMNFEYIDLAECSVKALEKIALENPYAILSSSALPIFFNLIDFFDSSVQNIVMKMMNNVSRCVGSQYDLENYVLGAIPALANFMKYRGTDDNSKKFLENTSGIFLNLCECIAKFFDHSPPSIPKFKTCFELISQPSMIANIFEILSVCLHSPEGITPKAWNNLLMILRYSVKFSPLLTKECIHNGIFNIIEQSLPSSSKVLQESQTPESSEVSILLLDAILPQKHLFNSLNQEEVKGESERIEIENEKEKIFKADNSHIILIAENILPKLFVIFEDTVSNLIKYFCLQAIDKIIHLCENSVLSNFLHPSQVSYFLNELLSSKESIFICFALKITEILLQKLPSVYSLPLQREGIMNLTNKLQFENELEKIKAIEQERAAFLLQSPFIRHFNLYAKSATEKFPSVQPIENFSKKMMRKHSRSKSGSFKDKVGKFLPSSFKKMKGEEKEGEFVLKYQKENQMENLKVYIFFKSKELIEKYIDNKDFGKKHNLNESEKIFAVIADLADQMISTLLEDEKEGGPFGLKKKAEPILKSKLEIESSSGVASKHDSESQKKTGLEEEIGGLESVFKKICGFLISENKLTNYELIQTGLLRSIYYTLCQTSSQIKSSAVFQVRLDDSAEEEVKLETEEQRLKRTRHLVPTDINKLKSIHHSFFSQLLNTKSPFGNLNAFTELIKSLHNLIHSIDRIKINIDQSKHFLSQAFDSNPANTLKTLGKKVKILVLYTPNGVNIEPEYIKQKEKSPELEKEEIKEEQIPAKGNALFQTKHQLFTELHSLVLSLEQWSPISVIEDFLQNRLKKKEDIMLFKPPRYYSQFAQKAKELFQTEKLGGENIPEKIEELMKERFMAEKVQREEFEILKDLEFHAFEEEEDEEESEDFDFGAFSLETSLKPNFEKEHQILEKESIISSYKGEKKVSFFDFPGFSKLEKDKEKDLEKGTINTTLDTDLSGKVQIVFYYNGHEIAKEITIFEMHRKYQNLINDVPKEGQGILMFQIMNSKKSRAHTCDSGFELPQSEIDNLEESYKRFEANYILKTDEQILFNIIKNELSFGVLSKPAESTKKKLGLNVFTDLDLQQNEQIDETAEMLTTGINYALKILKLLKLLSQHWNVLYPELDTPKIQSPDFLNHKLDQLILRQIQDPGVLMGGFLPRWMKEICTHCPFLLPFSTRLLFFKMTNFDKSRNLLYLIQHLKPRLQNIEIDSKLAKVSRQKVKLTRNKILDCAMKIMNSYGNSRAMLEFEYYSEEGSGLGPTLEFYTLVSTELRRANIWRQMEDNSLFPAPLNPNTESDSSTFRISEMFKLMGMIVGKAILDDRLVELPFHPLFWEIALGNTMGLRDVRRLDLSLGEFLLTLDKMAQKVQTIQEKQELSFEQKKRQIDNLSLNEEYKLKDLCMTLTMAGNDEILLKEGGKDIELTPENLREYINLNLYFLFKQTIQIQIQAFRQGFNFVFDLDSMSIFKSEEIEGVVCGNSAPKWEFQNLKSNIVPAHGYSTDSFPFVNFLRYMSELDKRKQVLLLKFLTGAPRLPLGGFAKLNPKLTVVKRICSFGEKPDTTLPTVTTCHNFLKLPEYSTYDILKKQFDYAITEGQGSFTLS